MRIDPKVFAAPVGTSATQRRAGAARGFAVLTESNPAKISATASASLNGLDALLALQGEGDATERRRRSLKRGHDLLDALDRLKAALLSERVGTRDLQAIASKLAERREMTDDPRLEELLSHIELRAKVELAKLGIG